MKTCSLGALLLVQETQEIGSFPMNGKMKSRKKKEWPGFTPRIYLNCTYYSCTRCRFKYAQKPKKLIQNDHMNLNIHGVWKSQKKSHLKLRAKRATFTFWVAKHLLKKAKNTYVNTCGLCPNIVGVIDSPIKKLKHLKNRPN